jgi:hypothetical protein
MCTYTQTIYPEHKTKNMRWLKCLGLLSFLFSFSTLIAQNSALVFDGENEFLSIPHNDAYNIGSGFTIEAWIFAEEWRDASWQGSIVAKDNQGPDRGFAFRCGDNGVLSFVMAVDNVWQEAFTGQVMNANQWHHVAVTVDAGTISLFIDGQESASNSFSGNPSHAPDMPINIGASPGFGGRHFDGVIDEVRIWSVARSQSEIADNMSVDLTGAEAGLAGYYPMNEGSGLVAGDISSTGNNASLNDMDDSNWVDGYTLPDFDISVQDVYGVDVVNMISRPVKLKVDIQNTGVQPISNVELQLSINGEWYTTEIASNTIMPNELYPYEFILPVDLIGLTDPEITVDASHPDDGNALNNAGTLMVKTGASDNIIVSDAALHKNGEQLNTFKMTLPNDLHKYEQMLLNIDLNCPPGGCGPWDVLADLRAVTATGTYEIARYITPYGIACGGWVVDITDFKSVLGGEVEFLTSIIVYTDQGWLLDMSIDLIDNDEQDTYTHLTPLWEKGYQVYGDPDISYDLPPYALNVQNNTENNHVRMTITGHGQGNTFNAAEFYEVNHVLELDGSAFHTHNVWKNDCAQNACDNQAGTWLFSRAGWCPGQEVIPYIINTTSGAAAGSSIELDYVLQEYTNLLNSGYNNTDHTEPYFKIFSYFVEESSTPYSDYKNLVADAAVPTVDNEVIEEVAVSLSNDGFEEVDAFTINIYYNGLLAAVESFTETIAVGTSVEKIIVVNENIFPGADDIFAEVVTAQDGNPGDNITKAQVANNTNELFTKYQFEIYPNPTSTGQVTVQLDTYWLGSMLRLYNSNGALLKTVQLANENMEIQLDQAGIYWYSLIHTEGKEAGSGKLIFVE